MKKFDEIKGIALGNFGLVTAAQARELGVTRSCLSRWVKMDWLEHPSRGVYRLTDFPPPPYDQFAALTEEFGPEARIVGESVLGMLELTSANPQQMHGGVPGRVRRVHSEGIVVSVIAQDEPIEYYEGVRSQSVFNAIRGCRGRLVPSRLREGVDVLPTLDAAVPRGNAFIAKLYRYSTGEILSGVQKVNEKSPEKRLMGRWHGVC